MRRYGKYIIAILITVLLASCGTRKNLNSHREGKNTVMPSGDRLPLPELKTAPSPTVYKEKLSPAMQALKEVLLNERTFHFTSKAAYYCPGTVDEFDGYIRDFEKLDEERFQLTQFTVIDLDGDMTQEIVFATKYENEYLILRYQDGNVLGNEIGIRSFEQLKTDSTVIGSSGADDNTISRIFFVGDTYFHDDIAHGTWECSLRDIPASEEEVNQEFDRQMKKPDVEWYDYTEAELERKLVDRPASTESHEPSRRTITERQNYLDSLAYLIDLSSYVYGGTDEEIEQSTKKYYVACKKELDKIYQLCLDKLSDEKKDSFLMNQQIWQKNWEKKQKEISDEESNTGYSTCAEIAFRRTFYLVNIYFDYHFYDDSSN